MGAGEVLLDDPPSRVYAASNRAVLESTGLRPPPAAIRTPSNDVFLSAVSASEGSIPMAVSTAERLTLPDEQAAPALTQTPARSSAMTWVSAKT